MTASPRPTSRHIDLAIYEKFPRPHANCYWVIPGRFLAGEYPGAYRVESARQRLKGYLAAGIRYFVDLTHPNDGLVPYETILADVATVGGMNVTYRRLPVYDMSVPSKGQMVDILDTIDRALAVGEGVYVHCWGGIGRTGTVVGCHLVRHGLTGDDALAQIGLWWQTVEKVVRSPRSPETDAQVRMIEEWVE